MKIISSFALLSILALSCHSLQLHQQTPIEVVAYCDDPGEPKQMCYKDSDKKKNEVAGYFKIMGEDAYYFDEYNLPLWVCFKYLELPAKCETYLGVPFTVQKEVDEQGWYDYVNKDGEVIGTFDPKDKL